MIRRTGLAIVTLSSETSAAQAARRARMLARQARVGILRNPNTPPRPPQRKARLTGKWPNLQSTRRPQAQARPDAAGAAPGVTDTDLARMMKERPAQQGTAPAGTGDETGSETGNARVTADGSAPLPRNAAPRVAQPQSRPSGDTLKTRVVITGFFTLFALTLLAVLL